MSVTFKEQGEAVFGETPKHLVSLKSPACSLPYSLWCERNWL